MALDEAAAVLAVQQKLSLTTAEAEQSVAVAVEYIGQFTGFDVLTDDPDNPDLFPQLTYNGVVLLGCRIYQDTPLPSGALSSFDDNFGGVPGVPRWLSSHLDQYFSHLDVSFGVA